MALEPSQEVLVDEDDLAPVVEVMDELEGASTGWINLVPEVEEGAEVAHRSMLAEIFSARGDPIPMATWTAPEAAGGRATLGVQHGAGPRALERLAGNGLALPDGWWKLADHSRRGLVVTTPAGADHEDVLWWLLTASHALSQVPLSGRWRADVYRG
ncbi:MAG: hypothetical protein U0P45_16060 [Acidimicrobiales bacterium]